MTAKPRKILPFKVLVHNLKMVEDNFSDKIVYQMLRIPRERFNFLLRKEQLQGSLQEEELYEKFFEYCKFRKIDANTFFTTKLEKSLLRAS